LDSYGGGASFELNAMSAPRSAANVIMSRSVGIVNELPVPADGVGVALAATAGDGDDGEADGGVPAGAHAVRPNAMSTIHLRMR